MSFHLCSLCLSTWHDETVAEPAGNESAKSSHVEAGAGAGRSGHTTSPPSVERRGLLRPCPRCVEVRGIPTLEKAA